MVKHLVQYPWLLLASSKTNENSEGQEIKLPEERFL
jgi:hypothetical protein